MVFGDKRPHLVAILVPDAAFLERFARDHGVPADMAALRDDAALRAALSEALERVNKALAPLERVRRFTVARAPFTVENQMMTPTLKIRRHEIKAAYGEELDGLY
jgi:long-chain acyl-CoA synthetase